jgi:hypothetical protein
MRRVVALLIAAGVLMMGSGLRVFAHEGHDHKIMGTVTMAAADHGACQKFCVWGIT